MSELGHVRQIDGLRFWAAFLVMTQHWIFNPLFLPMPAGMVGVTLFFVISGFLITGILLGARERLDAGTTTRRRELLVFYIRRALRIFPLYYLVVAILVVLGVPSARESLAWLLTYTLNLKFALIGGYEPVISHFWTLAIEEQFYLVYPLILLAWPTRRLAHVYGAFIAAGVLSRVIGVLLGLTDRTNTFITFTCFDALGCGAALAHVYRYRPEWFRKVAHAGVLLALLVIFSVGTAAWLRLGDEGSQRVMWLRLMVSLVSCWFIARAVLGFRGLPGVLLGNAGIVYLGHISYGLYVYHNLIGHALRDAGARAWSLPAQFAVFFVVTVAVSVASWHLFEWPINRLKRHVPYAPRPPVREPLPSL